MTQIKFWDKQFIDLAEQINIYRKAYISRFEGYFFDKIGGISSVFDGLETFATMRAGKGKTKLKCFNHNFERDLKLGYTSKGPHKADFNFKVHGHSVEGIISRGQLKLLLMYALKITQNTI